MRRTTFLMTTGLSALLALAGLGGLAVTMGARWLVQEVTAESQAAAWRQDLALQAAILAGRAARLEAGDAAAGGVELERLRAGLVTLLGDMAAGERPELAGLAARLPASPGPAIPPLRRALERWGGEWTEAGRQAQMRAGQARRRLGALLEGLFSAGMVFTAMVMLRAVLGVICERHAGAGEAPPAP